MYKINGNSVARTMTWAGVAIAGAAIVELCVECLLDAFTEYDKNGYNKEGIDREGYDRQGFNVAGFDKDGYDRQGFNIAGFDIEGYDADGFDAKGYARDGFNADGYDWKGYNREGRDISGFDYFGYDGEGYHKNGYNWDGYNREGVDWQGYGRDKYNTAGLDRYGNNRQYYAYYITKLYSLKDEAFKQLKSEEYVYALLDARMILEEAVNLIIGHNLGERGLGDSLIENLKICEKKVLLGDDQDFINRLHGVRKLCNPNMHSISNTENITHDQVHFAIMQVKELLAVVEDILIFQGRTA